MAYITVSARTAQAVRLTAFTALMLFMTFTAIENWGRNDAVGQVTSGAAGGFALVMWWILLSGLNEKYELVGSR